MRTLALFATALFAGAVMAEDKKQEKKVKDEEAIVGVWKVERVEVGEYFEVPVEKFPNLTYEFRAGGKMVNSVDGAEAASGTYTLDPGASPKAIDQVATDGGTKKRTKGVYRLDGDSLTLCLTTNSESDRPKEIKAIAPDTVVITLKRVKVEKKEEKKDK